MKPKLNVVILAAGKGTRMYSETPKVLHELAGKSLIEHVIGTARELAPDSITVVVGHQAERIQSALAHEQLNFALQEEQKGTAHAVEQALPYLEDDAVVLVLYGDVPLTEKNSLDKLLAKASTNSMSVLTCVVKNPTGLGRIIRDGAGNIEAIVEEKDSDEYQKNITEINTGIMAFPAKKLKQWIPRIGNNNKQNEYYLTDIVPLALEENGQVATVSCESENEACGVNTMLQLSELERAYQKLQAEALMLKGVCLADPSRLDIRGQVDIASDVQIDVNVILEGTVKIEKNVRISANCILKDCVIKAGTEIFPNTLIEESEIGSNCKVGPFARIRPGTQMSNNVKIGNFVETKKSMIGEGSKVNHLSYIGDSELGENINIGAGTITCNYDGVNKFKTIIEDDVFIGSNTALVAPVKINKGATVAAGSTITKDVESGQLALSRTKQTNINDWKRPLKK